MKTPHFVQLAILILFSVCMLLIGLYSLAKFKTLFKRSIKNEFLRRNVVVWIIGLCIITSVLPTTSEFTNSMANHKVLHYFLINCFGVTLEVLFVFNVTWIVLKQMERRLVSFRTQMTITLLSIMACTVVVSFPLNYLGNLYMKGTGSFDNVQYTVLFNFYICVVTGFIYITMSYVDLDRRRKLNEKELEVSRLQALKTKAELDALHSKINPHFLYNALNSIADLSITDGKKARKMTVALADLFRYSINYSNHNYSTVKEEVEMTEVYLAIEKIRFEDRLTYTISIENELNHYLIPRFVLQPIVENAVKHGLKATGKVTMIAIEVKEDAGTLQLEVFDNGPLFPDELIPGYGVKSIYDKLDLLFPDCYEIHFSNTPKKKVSIQIHKLLKNEPVV